jgi:HEAT repeat protein
VRLAADIVEAGKALQEAVRAAVQRGDAAEDDSQGHALFHDPASRSVQERFVGYAARELKELRRVLRDSSDAEQRALAAEILGYVANKRDVVGDLVYGMRDASAEVRNAAMRALAVFASMPPTSGRPIVRVPYESFVDLLQSPVWTDRNKASLALARLSERRDPRLLAKLRREAMVPLIEMARWKSEGHAIPALLILGRIAGQSDEAIQMAWTRGEREGIINAALKR